MLDVRDPLKQPLESVRLPETAGVADWAKLSDGRCLCAGRVVLQWQERSNIYLRYRQCIELLIMRRPLGHRNDQKELPVRYAGLKTRRYGESSGVLVKPKEGIWSRDVVLLLCRFPLDS